jgi:hypothetical protein
VIGDISLFPLVGEGRRRRMRANEGLGVPFLAGHRG